MNKMEEAKEFLKEIGMPRAQLSDICCLSLLALAGLKPEMKWNEAINKWIRIHDIIAFVNEFYGKQYAENSRETFRKQAMHHFRTAALIEDNREATNSPNYRYRLTEEVLQLLRNFGLQSWDENISKFMINHEKLIAGFYISGFPLDSYKTAIDNFCNIKVEELKTIFDFKKEN